MNHIADVVLTDLQHWLKEVGKGGGYMSPSVYDTAQVLRWAPPAEGVEQALGWLMQQQHTDGGWGSLAVAHGRDLPTLAAIVALHASGKGERERTAVQRGLEFLRRQAEHWAGPIPQDLLVGAELLLPRVLDDAAALGLDVPRAQYEKLIELGARRRKLLSRLPSVEPGSTFAHSFEVLDREPDLKLLDSTGGVGSSPAATAAWLHAASKRPELSAQCDRAREYLRNAAAASGAGIPGVVCTAWPIIRFEQSFVLYALWVGGLLQHPKLRELVEPQLVDLGRALKPTGIGFSDDFAPDVDDTAEAVAVLKAAGHPVDPACVRRFAHEDHFATYFGELQSSVTATIHAVHALSLFGDPCTPQRQYVLQQQLPDGTWRGDKWNGSWLYATCQVLIGLEGKEFQPAIDKAVAALAKHEHSQGGWGIYETTAEETAYVVLALRTLLRHGALPSSAHALLDRGERWMLANYRPFNVQFNTCWIAKEVYRPPRIARVIELVATMPRVLD